MKKLYFDECKPVVLVLDQDIQVTVDEFPLARRITVRKRRLLRAFITRWNDLGNRELSPARMRSLAVSLECAAGLADAAVKCAAILGAAYIIGQVLWAFLPGGVVARIGGF